MMRNFSERTGETGRARARAQLLLERTKLGMEVVEEFEEGEGGGL